MSLIMISIVMSMTMVAGRSLAAEAPPPRPSAWRAPSVPLPLSPCLCLCPSASVPCPPASVPLPLSHSLPFPHPPSLFLPHSRSAAAAGAFCARPIRRLRAPASFGRLTSLAQAECLYGVDPPCGRYCTGRFPQLLDREALTVSVLSARTAAPPRMQRNPGEYHQEDLHGRRQQRQPNQVGRVRESRSHCHTRTHIVMRAHESRHLYMSWIMIAQLVCMST